jgi:hypothetical protein
VGLVDPAGHAYPALQFPLHAAVDCAVVPPYRPAAHAVHVPDPPRLYCPAGHGAAVALVDPATHTYPAAHGLHDADPAALH